MLYRQLLRKIKKHLGLSLQAGRKYQDINPEDIFLDSTNLPGFGEHRFEGRIERPMSRKTFLIVKIVLAFMILALVSKLWVLEINLGSIYAQISENNRLESQKVSGTFFQSKERFLTPFTPFATPHKSFIEGR